MDRVLVLNSDFTPINVTTSIKGYILVSKGKAEILKSSDIPINCGEHQYIYLFYHQLHFPYLLLCSRPQ